jgi:Peptidase A4 family
MARSAVVTVRRAYGAAVLAGLTCLVMPQPRALAASVSAISSTTGAAVPTATTANWSGYVVTGGPYTSVSGTFNIPSVAGYVAGSTVSEWIGVNGYT